LRAIERAAGDVASWPWNNFHTLDRKIVPSLREQAGNRAVAATDIQDTASFRRNQRGQRIGKDAGTAAKDQGAMAARDPGEGPGLGRRSHRIGNVRRLFHIS